VITTAEKNKYNIIILFEST